MEVFVNICDKTYNSRMCKITICEQTTVLYIQEIVPFFNKKFYIYIYLHFKILIISSFLLALKNNKIDNISGAKSNFKVL